MGRSWRSSEISEFITAMAARLKPSARSILDLGVADGDLAPLLMDRYRGARLRGIDHDQSRLDLIEGRLGFYEGRVELIAGDLLEVGYGSGHDLAVSTTALRHFGQEDKVRIYRRVHQALGEGGVFLFGDRVKIGSPRVSQAIREIRAAEMQALADGPPQPPSAQRSPDSRDRVPIGETLYALRRAAFLEAECVYCYGDRAVFIGFR